ncbi:hypothetical protein CPLU01_13901 [Colletotrichum plurivorum]|uniref:Uncharacterized protein n=1 Tax=Colletotrichum plurivorum TaxID=2175906 RepID=A0A8H6N1U3_9PEZI|nr:hypothetical protein CPLU01_13901 [Colletotrichum plurivorum]
MTSTLRPTPSPEDVDRRGIGADVEVDEAGCHRLDGRSLDGSSAVVDLKEAGLSQSTTNEEGFRRSGAPSPESLLARSKALLDHDTPPIGMKQSSTANNTRPKTPEDSTTRSPLPTFAVALPMEPQVARSPDDKRKTVCEPVQDGQEGFEGEGSVMGGERTHSRVLRGQRRSRSPLAPPCKPAEPVLSHSMERYLASIDPDEFEAYRNRENGRKESEGQPTEMAAIETTLQEKEQSDLAPIDTTREEEQADLGHENPLPAQQPSATPTAADELQPPPPAEETEHEGTITITEGLLEVGTDRSASDSAVEDVEPTPAELHQRLQVDVARLYFGAKDSEGQGREEDEDEDSARTLG